MNYTKLFYWLVVADQAKTFFFILAIFFGVISVISTVCYIFNAEDNEAQRMSRKWMWWSVPIFIFWACLWIFTPSRKDALLIVAGGQTLNFLTTDKTAKQIPHELSNFVVTELKNMAKDASVDLNIKEQKQKVLDRAKNMTAEELMNEMKKDSTLTKLILEN